MKRSLLLATLVACGSLAAFSEDKLITEQPEGVLRTYHGCSYSSYMQMVEIHEYHDGVARKVVFDNNGKDVWFHDPITHVNGNAWIKGTIENDTITIETPQPVDETKTGLWYCQRLKKVVKASSTGVEYDDWVPDTQSTSIKYLLSADSIIQIPEKDIMLGLTRGGEYKGYGEREQVYSRVREQAAKIPEGLKEETWSLSYNNGLYGSQVKMAFDGNDVYMKGFWKDFPTACIKGTVKDNTVSFPSRQYLGFLQGAKNSYYMYFMHSTRDTESMITRWTSLNEDVVFSYDKDNGVLTPTFSTDMAPLVRGGKTEGVTDYDNARVILLGMNMKRIDKIGELPPVKLQQGCIRLENDYGWGSIEFDLLCFDADGNGLNPNKLTYSIWLDDEILVIDKEDANFPEQYAGVDKPMTEIPYLFTNDYGIDDPGSEAHRYIMFFKLGWDEIGVQYFYNDDLSGKKLASKISYIDPITWETRVKDPQESAVSELGSADAVPVSTVIYDVNGSRVADSYKGIVIEKCTYSDGTVRTVKKFRR